eukprot:s2025_g3.t1
MVTLPENLKWAWLQSMPSAYAFAMPQTYDATIWQPGTACHVLRHQKQPSAVPLRSAVFEFHIASINVLSIADGHSSTQSSTRCVRLDQQFHKEGFAFLCMQETRTPEGQRVTDHYQIFASGFQICGRAHHFGCEIWLSKSLPICTIEDGRKLFVKDFKVTVTHSDPRCLVLKLTGPLQIVVVSAHAPCLSASRTIDEVKGWWEGFASVVAGCSDDGLFLCGIDANAPISGPECDQFGIHGAETSNEAGQIFQQLLIEHDLIAPASFQEHEGPEGTWRHPRGMWLRRDYMLVNRRAMAAVARSFTMSDVDTGFGHVDHIPVALAIRGLHNAEITRHKYKWDYAKLGDAACQKRFQDALRTLPIPNRNVEVESHARIVEGQIMQLAQQHFALCHQRIKHRPLLQPETINLIQQKRQALQLFRQPGFTDCEILKQELKQFDTLIRPKVVADQKAWYDDWIQQIQESGAIHDHRALFAKLQRLGHKKKAQAQGPRPLPMLCKPSGEAAMSFEESQEIFISQFAKIEAGIKVSQDQLRQLHKPHVCATAIDVSLCPTPYDLLKHIRKMKNRKPPGPGGLVVEVLKAGGEVMCHHLAPLFAKAILHQQEPLHWKSGLLIPLFKGKGSTRSPDSYRSIFLSDSIAKVHHGTLRRRLVEAWNDNTEVIQYGGKKGYATDLAHHILNAFVAWGRAHNTSVGLLFIDLQSAFYSVLRESFFEGPIDDRMVCHAMNCHGIVPQDWHQIRAQIEKDAALAAECRKGSVRQEAHVLVIQLRM